MVACKVRNANGALHCVARSDGWPGSEASSKMLPGLYSENVLQKLAAEEHFRNVQSETRFA